MNREIIFQKNLAALSERNPQLVQKVRDTRENSHYNLIRSRKGYPNLMIESDSGRVLFYDPEDPIKYSREYLEGLKVKYAPFVFFMGLGLGYHLDLFLRNLSNDWKTKETIIYEKDIELFRLALHTGDYQNVLKHPNIHFFVGEDPDDTFIKLHTEILARNIFDLRSIKIIPLPPSIMLNGSYYLDAVEVVKKAACQIMIDAGNDSFDSLVGLEHMFLNLKHIFSNPGIKDLYGKFKGNPGILVAAGPSLNKNMHLLKGLEDRALIISCDASLIPLMKKGIRPHLVTSLERTPETLLHYDKIDDFKNIYFITLPILTPETVESFKGKKFIAYRKYSYFDWLENDKGSLIVGHSVANLAFKILVHLNCNPIILVGQDLSFAKDGDTHFLGVITRNRDEDILNSAMIELEGNDGKPVKSIKYWEIFKLEFEKDIHSYSGTCINATEGGAKIKGAKIMSFRNAIENYCRKPYNPQTILDETYNQFSCNYNMRKETEKILHKTRDTCRIVKNAICDFEAALDEAQLGEREIIQPFLKGEISSDVDMGRLLSIEKKWIELNNNFETDRNLFEITAQTLNAYDIWLASELSFLKDIYTDQKILSMARVKKMKEWFAVVGSFLIFTRDVLRKAETMLADELRQGSE